MAGGCRRSPVIRTTTGRLEQVNEIEPSFSASQADDAPHLLKADFRIFRSNGRFSTQSVLVVASRCRHRADGVEGQAFGRALGHSGRLRPHPDHVHVHVRTLFLGWGGQQLFHDRAASVLHRNGVSSIHMRWRMTASFLATAITAFLCPRVSVSFTPQALSGDHLLLVAVS